jgi:drug/metabolite transporter (DMT)-like permease
MPTKLVPRDNMTGVLAAVLSSTLGGMTAAFTRYVIGATDPVTLAAFRFGIGIAIILPVAFMLHSAWPRGRDRIGVGALGILFFAFFFVIYNLALGYTTAARGSLALSTLPLATMVVAALVGREALSARKTLGVLVAVAGVALTLAAGLADAPVGAWRGDLVMVAGTLCMALYNVWSQPFIARSSRLGFLAMGMGCGAACSASIAWVGGGFDAVVSTFGPAQWSAIAFIGAFGGAGAFYLWVYALERTTPTRVANTMTVNPIAASLLAALLINEPLGLNLVVGIITVGAGIWIASTERPTSAPKWVQRPPETGKIPPIK